MGHSLCWKTCSFILTKSVLLHMGVQKSLISFLLCSWTWYNNWVYWCNYLPFTFVNCNFCLFCNENQLVWSLEKHLRLRTVSNEQTVFWCKWKAKLRVSFISFMKKDTAFQQICPYFFGRFGLPYSKAQTSFSLSAMEMGH